MAHLRREIKPQKHHEQTDICASRATYRQGRKETAVKVYTVNLESKYLLIQGIPGIGLKQELEDLCGEFGAVLDVSVLDEYPAEEFTEVYYVKYQNIQEARIAKKRLDNRSFFGGALHVCYAPEFETVQDVREKLQGRRKFIAAKTRGKKISDDKTKNYSNHSSASSSRLPSAATYAQQSQAPIETNSYIWAGKTCTIEEPQTSVPTPAVEESCHSANICENDASSTKSKASSFVPRQLKRNLDSLPKKPVSVSSKKSFFSGLHSEDSPSWRYTSQIPQSSANETDTSISASIRAKLASVGVPSLDVSLKRRKKH